MALHFAYGSNVLIGWIKTRVHKANVYRGGRAKLENFKLVFNKLSRDKSGKANLKPIKGQTVWGVVYELSCEDMDKLKNSEGSGYELQDGFTVVMDDGEEVTANTFVAVAEQECLRPYDWYLSIIKAGAIERCFPDEYKTYLCGVRTYKNWEFLED